MPCWPFLRLPPPRPPPDTCNGSPLTCPTPAATFHCASPAERRSMSPLNCSMPARRSTSAAAPRRCTRARTACPSPNPGRHMVKHLAAPRFSGSTWTPSCPPSLAHGLLSSPTPRAYSPESAARPTSAAPLRHPARRSRLTSSPHTRPPARSPPPPTPSLSSPIPTSPPRPTRSRSRTWAPTCARTAAG